MLWHMMQRVAHICYAHTCLHAYILCTLTLTHTFCVHTHTHKRTYIHTQGEENQSSSSFVVVWAGPWLDAASLPDMQDTRALAVVGSWPRKLTTRSKSVIMGRYLSLGTTGRCAGGRKGEWERYLVEVRGPGRWSETHVHRHTHTHTFSRDCSSCLRWRGRITSESCAAYIQVTDL